MGQGEGPSEQSTVDAVLRGEDVQALLVTEENLKKVCYCDAMLFTGRCYGAEICTILLLLGCSFR